ncbi:hypothetical protein LguiB_015437 [Lonicera macranthoides]
MSHLKKSLSETLTRFYPLAGRVKNFTSVDCNDEGVLYREARANFRLPEYLENPNLNLLNKFLASDEDNHIPVDTDVMVVVQVTTFDCGGIVIGLRMLHRIVDASTMTLFLNSWAETSRGYEKITYPDLTTASHLFPSADSLPSSLLSFVGDVYSPESGFLTRRFVFDASAISAIKARATSEAVPNPTRVEALTGLFWGRLIVAHKATTGALKNISFASHAVNLRRRMELPLPNQTLGNLVWMVVAMFAPSDSDPELHELVESVHDTFANLSSEVIKELQGEGGREIVINQSKELLTVNEIEKIEVFRFTSWCNMGVYESDFGWGKPVWVGIIGDHVGPKSKRGVLLMDSRPGDGVEVWITDNKQVMALLEKDSEILAYATTNPPIPIPIPTPTP